MLVLVDMVRVLDDRITIVPLAIAEDFVETALPAGMAGNPAALLDLHDDNVIVTVQPQLVENLRVAGFLTFAPQLAARAGPVHRAAFAGGELQGLAVHPGDHQHAAAGSVLGDGGNRRIGTAVVAIEGVGVGVGVGHRGRPVGGLGSGPASRSTSQAPAASDSEYIGWVWTQTVVSVPRLLAPAATRATPIRRR